MALFRYSFIREAADPTLTKAERGLMVRALAARDPTGPGGERVRVARNTLDRWIRNWRAGGFEALVPSTRSAEPATPAAVLDLAVKLKREVTGRTAAQVAGVIFAAEGWGPSARTIQRLFARLGLNTRPDGTPPAAFGRFEAAAANDRWTGDALHGPAVGGHKAYRFAFLDDHSRALVGYRWGHSEDTVRLEAALRHGLASRGVPRSIYVENVPRNIFVVLCPAQLCVRGPPAPLDDGGETAALRRSRAHNDQSEASQLRSVSSVRQTGRPWDPTEEPGGSVARRASILARVLISA